MAKKPNIVGAIYQKIAVDIARDIVNGKYKEGQKLSGRTMLASYYKVSPETIRKSCFILKDLNILDVEKGSGIEVLSAKKAKEYVTRFNDASQINDIKNDLLLWMKKQREELSDIDDKIRKFMSLTEKFSNIAPAIMHFEVTVTALCPVVNKCIGDTNFWQNTGGTIIAIKRNETIIVSPGPYATLTEGDILCIVCNDDAVIDVKKFLNIF